MLTLWDLLHNTPVEVRDRSKLCTHRRVSSRKMEDGLYHEEIYRATCTDGPRKITVRYYDVEQGGKKAQVALNSPIWVSCDCPYWLYYCEVAVAAKDSTEIIYSNGAKPVVRNPRMISYCCKHLFRIASRLRTRLPRTRRPRARGPRLSAANDEPRLAEDIIRDVLVLVLDTPATLEQLEDDLFGAVLPSELEQAIKTLLAHRCIQLAGQDYTITKRGLNTLLEML